MMKIAPVKATITGSGTRFKYSLNDDSTLEKLKKNATLRDVVVDNNKTDNSVSIQLNTGAYLTVLVPLVGFYLKNKGKEIDSKNTKGHKVMIKDAERQSDARGVIVSTMVDLEVDGQHVET